MRSAVIFPDIELLLINRLRPYLTNAYLGRDYPRNAYSNVITLRRQGGVRKNPIIETVRLGVNSYAQTPKEATDLALEIRATLESLADTAPLGKIEADGITEIKDNTNMSRRYFILSADVRGKEMAERM